MRIADERVLHAGPMLAALGGVAAGYITAIGTGRHLALAGALVAFFGGYVLSIGYLRTMSRSTERELLWR
ncbi:hypothetical protein [Halorubrum ezzemoulense]|uniref:Uncharacterized protein n=1 Tax=Halorubrum ezzemoulense TaxID=337243 RepID=A0A256JUN3_HALEZ|nr:hypothetical protein [Halorubrum ezzemoulense]OYR72614.1 hypothetical protein DJ76_12120 [Halorubrum ezzemoulense]